MPGQAWRKDTAQEAQRGFSCVPEYQGRARLNEPSGSTQHIDLVSCYISISVKTSSACVGGGALTVGCQNRALWNITQSKHLIHPRSDSLINVPAYNFHKQRPVEALVHLFIMGWNNAESRPVSDRLRDRNMIKRYSDIFCYLKNREALTRAVGK